MNCRLIAFDMDGTLYKTESSFIPTMENLFAEYGMKLPPRKELLSIIGETTGYFEEWLAGTGFYDSKTVFQRISELEYEAIGEKGELYEGVLHTLEYLKKTNFRIALCTNGPKPYWQKIIDKFNMNAYFDNYQYPQFKGDSKSNMLFRLEKLYRPEVKIMVGDRNIDRKAAIETDYTFYGAAYGYCYEESEMFENKIERITDLIGIIRHYYS